MALPDLASIAPLTGAALRTGAMSDSALHGARPRGEPRQSRSAGAGRRRLPQMLHRHCRPADAAPGRRGGDGEPARQAHHRRDRGGCDGRKRAQILGSLPGAERDRIRPVAREYRRQRRRRRDRRHAAAGHHHRRQRAADRGDGDLLLRRARRRRRGCRLGPDARQATSSKNIRKAIAPSTASATAPSPPAISTRSSPPRGSRARRCSAPAASSARSRSG